MLGIVLVGADHELLVLARRTGVEVAVVADPRVTGAWQGFAVIASDAEVIAALSPSSSAGIHRPSNIACTPSTALPESPLSTCWAARSRPRPAIDPA